MSMDLHEFPPNLIWNPSRCRLLRSRLCKKYRNRTITWNCSEQELGEQDPVLHVISSNDVKSELDLFYTLVHTENSLVTVVND